MNKGYILEYAQQALSSDTSLELIGFNTKFCSFKAFLELEYKCIAFRFSPEILDAS